MSKDGGCMHELLKKSKKLSRALQFFELSLGTVILFVLFANIITNVFLRYVFFKPLFWSDELSNYLFIWMSFLASSFVMAEDGHVRVTAIESRLPKKMQLHVRIAMKLIMLVTFGLYIWPSIRMLGKLKKSNMLEVPLQFVYIIMPICFFLMCLHIVGNIVFEIADSGIEEPPMATTPENPN